MRYLTLILMLLALLVLSPIASAQPLAQATSTYTPVPTRTQVASTQAVTVITVGTTPATFAMGATAGDVFIVVGLAVIAVMLGIGFAYSWAKSHIRVAE